MNILTRRVVDLVNELQGRFPGLESDFSKVKKTLSSFATAESKKLSELLVMDICDKQDHLLLRKALFTYTGKTLNSRYAGETTCRIKKILKSFFSSEGEEPTSLPISRIPAFIRETLWAFPLDLPQYRRNISSRILSDPDYRNNLPLTIHGHRILRAVLEIVDEHGLSDLEPIFGYKSTLLTKKIKALYNWNDAKHILDSCYRIRKRLGLVPTKIVSQSNLLYETFPTKLKHQCEVFLQKALLGLNGDPVIEKLAALKGISIDGLKQSTIDSYLIYFKSMMSRVEIDFSPNFDITNLLKIEVKTLKDETGEEVIYMFNPIVDRIREIERNRDSPTKKAGHDSVAFNKFLSAVKAIAAYNGIFGYHKNFNLAYRTRIDVKTKEKRKKIKRQIYDLQWIDDEIQRLFLEFKKIIKEKSFIRNFRTYPNRIADQNLKKCLFFVMLVMLRYMGVRQQLLRNCVVGKNIIFEKTGRISFYWSDDENKNKVEIYGYLDPDEHRWTHKVIMDVLKLYFDNIYNYTKKISVNPGNRQFLCRLTKYGRCKEFDLNDSKTFGQTFSRWSSMFLEFGGRDMECEDHIHTQFFRGMCADWLHFECKVSARNSASFIGDTEETLREHYLSKNRSHYLNDALDEANKNKREMEEKKADQTNAVLARTLENLLIKQDALEKENRLLKEQLKKAA